MHSKFSPFSSRQQSVYYPYMWLHRVQFDIKKIHINSSHGTWKMIQTMKIKGQFTSSCCLAIGHFLRRKCTMLSVRISGNWCPKWPHRIHLKLRIDIFYCSLIINDYSFLTAAKGQHSFPRKHNRNLDFIKTKN